MNICEVYKKVQSSTQSEKVLLTSTNFVTKGVSFSSSTLSYKMGHLKWMGEIFLYQGWKKNSWPRTWGAWRDLKSQGALKKSNPPQAGLWVKVFGNKCRFSDESCIIFQPYDTRFIFIFWQIRILSERKNAKFHIHSKWTFDLSSYLEFYWESFELYLSLSKLTEVHFKMHANFECIERFQFFSKFHQCQG